MASVNHFIEQLLNASHQSGVLLSKYLFDLLVIQSLLLKGASQNHILVLFKQLDEAFL